MLARCGKLKKTQLSGHQSSGKSDFNVGCTKWWPKNKIPTLYFLLHSQALYNEWSRMHAQIIPCTEENFCALEVMIFSALLRHIFDISNVSGNVVEFWEVLTSDFPN